MFIFAITAGHKIFSRGRFKKELLEGGRKMKIDNLFDWLRAGRSGGQSSSPNRVKNFYFSLSSIPYLRPRQPPVQSVELFPRA
jgi:hypothetical protein